MNLGPDLTPYEEALPKEWQDMLDEMEAAGSDVNHREAVRARIDIAIVSGQIIHSEHGADVQRKHETSLEDRREAFRKAMTDRAEKFQNATEAATQKRHDEAMQSAADDRAAAKIASNAAETNAKALNKATNILAFATVVLVIVTAIALF